MKKVKLHDICKLERGSSPRPIQNYITTAEDGVNWVKIGDTDPTEKYVNKTAEKITKEGAKKSRKVEIGDFILSNSMSLGHPFIMNIDGYIHDGWFVLRPDYTTVDREFLYYTLLSDYVQTQFKGTCTGSVVKNIRSELVNDLDIFLPELSEQKRIAKVLTDIDSKIALNKKIGKELEIVAKEIYDYWFTQFDFPCETGKPYKSYGGKMTFNPIIKSEIPENWEVKKLGEISSFKNGINYDPSKPGTIKTKIINVRNITASSYIINDTDLDELLLESKDIEKYQIKKNDLVVSRSGTPGAVRLISSAIEGNLIYCGFIICVHINDTNLKNIVFFNLKSIEESIMNRSAGTIMSNISQDSLNDLNIIIPDRTIIEKFNKTITPIILKIQKIVEENQSLSSLRNELLPMLMNGQVSVKD